jgi:hypothetical protein
MTPPETREGCGHGHPTVAAIKAALADAPDDACVSIQLQDDLLPVGFAIDASNFITDGYVLIFPDFDGQGSP